MNKYLAEYYQGQYPDLTKVTVEIEAYSEAEVVDIIYRYHDNVYQLLSITKLTNL